MKNKYAISIIALLIVFAPITNLVHQIAPAYLFGKSAWVAIPAIILAIVFVVNLTKFNRINQIACLIGIALLGYLILNMSSLVYGESKNILDYRYILTFPMYLILADFFLRFEDSRKFLVTALIIQGVIASMIFIINAHFFPNIQIQPDDYGVHEMIFDGERTRNMLLGASTSGNMILIAMFALAFWHFYNQKFINYVFWPLQLCMIYGISLGGSRYPLVSGLCILLFCIFLKNPLKNLFSLLVTFLCLFGFVTLSNIEILESFRFNHDLGGRVEKIQLSLSLIFESATHFFIGLPMTVAANASSPEGYGISDNSYLAIALSFGVPFTFLFFKYLISLNNWKNSDGLYKLFTIYFLFGLGVTNSIYWESYIFIASFCWLLLLRQPSFLIKASRLEC
jgi:hypothetical protein